VEGNLSGFRLEQDLALGSVRISASKGEQFCGTGPFIAPPVDQNIYPLQKPKLFRQAGILWDVAALYPKNGGVPWGGSQPVFLGRGVSRFAASLPKRTSAAARLNQEKVRGTIMLRFRDIARLDFVIPFAEGFDRQGVYQRRGRTHRPIGDITVPKARTRSVVPPHLKTST